MAEYELTFRRGKKKLNDSFAVSLTGTVLFFFLDGTDFSMYPFSFSYLSFSWFCPGLFTFFVKNATELLRSSVLRLLYYHVLFLILVLWLSLFLVFILFILKVFFFVSLVFYYNFCWKSLKLFFFFLLAETPHNVLSLHGFPTFKCFYFCCFHNWNSVA